jgi:ATP-dependent Clp protease ATP-binding subunit ClpA
MVLTRLKTSSHADVMFERFTAYARHVVVLAQEEARRLNHNYIGTEHILLGLLGERDGLGFRVLESFGMSLDEGREEVVAAVGAGKAEPGKHIPFTPRAKKTLELSLREALNLGHHYIGTEHILLGLIREGDGVAAQIMRKHGDLRAIRTAVIDAVPEAEAKETKRTTALRWARRRVAGLAERDAPAAEESLTATPAADATLTEATRLAGGQPVGSHHLLLAALADANSAAARVLAALGVDLERAKESLRGADVRGTSDEQPEVAGGRQMVIHVGEDRVTIEAVDPVIVAAGQAALGALGQEAPADGTIRGDEPAGASLSSVWQALRESLAAIEQQRTGPEAAQIVRHTKTRRTARPMAPGEKLGEAAGAE